MQNTHSIKTYDCIFNGACVGTVRGTLPKQAANRAFLIVLKHMKNNNVAYVMGTEIPFSVLANDPNRGFVEHKYTGVRTFLDNPVSVPRTVIDKDGNSVASTVTYSNRNVVRRVTK